MTETELREVDAKIHRDVFGSTDIRTLPTYFSPDCGNPMIAEPGWAGAVPDLWYLPTYDHDETSDIFCRYVPRYSTDIAAAWRVVEALAEGEYVKVYACESHYHGSSCTVIAADVTQQSPDDLVRRTAVVMAESVPLAICLAALKATASTEATA